jgi:hypothetical protein
MGEKELKVLTRGVVCLKYNTKRAVLEKALHCARQKRLTLS